MVAAVLLAVVGAGPAAAHAALDEVDPPPGAVLPAAPAVLRLSFTENVSAPEGGLVLVDAAGTAVPVTARAVDRDVVVDVPALDDGSYVLTWRVVSADGHPITGSSDFSVAATPPTATPPTATPAASRPSAAPTATSTAAPAPPSAPDDDAAPSAPAAPAVVPPPATEPDDHTGMTTARHGVQTAVHLGVVGAGGLVLFEWLVLAAPRGAVHRVRRRLRRWTLACSALATLALLVCVPLTTAWQVGLSPLDPAVWRAVPGSPSTPVMAVGALGTAVVGLAVLAATPVRRWPWRVALVGATVGMLSLAGVGHTRTVGPAPLVVTADVLHVVVAAVWFGGVLGLGVVLARASDASAARAARTVTRFSTLAAAAVGALAVTGLVLAWRVLGSVDALLTTGYGRTLLVKVGVAGVVVGLAAWNRSRLVTRVRRDDGARRTLRRVVAAEAGLLAGVLAVTAVLVAQSPGTPAAALPPPPPGPGPTAAATAVPTGPRTVEREIEEGPSRSRWRPRPPARTRSRSPRAGRTGRRSTWRTPRWCGSRGRTAGSGPWRPTSSAPGPARTSPRRGCPSAVRGRSTSTCGRRPS